MSFNKLLNLPMTERKLLVQIVRIVQKNYSNLQGLYFFLKIEKADSTNSHIVWVKQFYDEDEFGDFYWDAKYERACIMVKSIGDHYELLCKGFRVLDRFKIWATSVSKSRPIIRDMSYDNIPMISRDLCEKGFGEIIETLKSSKTNKAM
jgi:hypothetical protein